MDYIDQVFGSDGILSKRFDGYQPREGQVQLSRAVGDAFIAGDNLIAEAPTGTGKSFAYLVPAVYQAAGAPNAKGPTQPARRTIVVTANIALQEQIVGKDLPFLSEIMPWPFTYALTKGRSNYLCLDRFDDTTNEQLLDPFRDPDDREAWAQIVDWKEQTKKGDVSELPFVASPLMRGKFTIGSDDCLRRKCPSYEECFAEAARRETKKAQIVVTNYHLFFTNLQIRLETGENLILPDYDCVVFDEGHKAADIARDFFGFKVTAGSIRYAARLLGGSSGAGIDPIDPDLRERVTAEADDFFGQLRVFRNDRERYSARLREENPVDSSSLDKVLGETIDAYRRTVDKGGMRPKQLESLRKMLARCEKVRGYVSTAMQMQDDGMVYYLEEDQKHRVTLCGKPIDVADTLRENAFEDEATRSAVVVSATLTTSPGNFDHVATELGAEGADDLEAASPFDYQKQAMLVLPKMPSPSDRNRYPDAVADAIAEIVRLSGGRALCLFTSYRNLNHTYDRLKRERLPFRILKQGDRPRTMLAQDFRDDVPSVLLGTESFWAGVDVPGESLSVLTIDRLPFPTPDDPVLDAIQDRHGNSFGKYSMPRALIQFRQGAGRLIRSVKDRGVIVVLDNRVATKGYGKQFLRALPKMKTSRELSDIETFLNRGESAA